MAEDQLSLLDNIRLNNGPDGLRNYYRGQLKQHRETAFELINDQNLRYETLFLLRHEISSHLDVVNPLFKKALEITSLLTDKKPAARLENTLRSDSGSVHSVLKWMLQTGYYEDIPDRYYCRLMERVAALLTKSFKDTSVLSEIAEMIFARNRNGKLIHELVWAFFEACDPGSIYLIAKRLYSNDERDEELAKRLLCFIPEIDERPLVSGMTQYNRVLNWLQENMPFLYYTGESLHLCHSPKHYTVSLPAKYLCRPVSAENGEPLNPMNSLENELSSKFKILTKSTQKQLADFSYLLYVRNPYQWNIWIMLPLSSQLFMASQMMGGLT